MDMQNTILELASPYLEAGLIDGIRISTRPDYISEEILDNLQDKGVTTIELGIQSTDPIVLEASERGYRYEQILDSIVNLMKYDFQVGLQMMTGLPYDTRLKSIKTALDFVAIKPSFVRIYPTLVVRGATLEEQFTQGEYSPLSLDDAVEWIRDIKIVFEHHNINVIRIGLQAQEGFNKGQDLIGGPYHPAFGEMVESSIYRVWMSDIIQSLLDYESMAPASPIAFRVHPSRLSQAIGQKKYNILYLSKIFPNYKVSIEQNNLVEIGDMAVFTDQTQLLYSRKSFISQRYEGIVQEMTN